MNNALYRRIYYHSLGQTLSNVMASPSSSGTFDEHLMLLDKYHALGGNCLHLHGEGGETQSRKAAGKWLRDKNLREEFFICTQICHDDWNDAEQKPINRFASAAVVEDIERDLELLGIDRLDMVYLSDSPEKDFRPVIEALVAEQNRGRIGTFGFYNWQPPRIAGANDHARTRAAKGGAAIVTTELALAKPVNPLWPGYVPFDSAMKQLVQTEGMTVLAWVGDINQGLHLFEAGDAPKGWRPEWIQRWETAANRELTARVSKYATSHQLSAREVNTAWLLNQDFPVAGIVNLNALFTDFKDGGLRTSHKLLMRQDLALLNPV